MTVCRSSRAHDCHAPTPRPARAALRHASTRRVAGLKRTMALNICHKEKSDKGFLTVWVAEYLQHFATLAFVFVLKI